MKKAFCIFCIALLFSCGGDDPVNSNTIESFIFPDFTVVSVDDTSFYEYDFQEFTQTGVEVNLTQSEAIPRQVSLVHRNPPVYGFYSAGNAYVKNFDSGTVQRVDDFGSQSSDEIRITARNDGSTLGLIYGFINEVDTFLRLINIENNSRNVIPLGVTSSNVQLYIQNGYAYVLDSGLDNASLRIFDVSMFVEVAAFQYDKALTGVVFGEDNDFYVFGFDGEFIQYTSSNFLQESSGSANYIPDERRNVKIEDQVLYGHFSYPQPNLYEVGPASYDLTSGETTFIDIAAVFGNYQPTDADQIERIDALHFDYSLTEQVWLIAVVVTKSDTSERYAVLAVNQSEEVVAEHSLERSPWTMFTE